VQYNVNKGSSQVGKIMLCLPPGTGDWAANAGDGSWRSAFNNDWCLSLPATMHDVGHMFDLDVGHMLFDLGPHSKHDDAAYDNRTGLMSYNGVKDPHRPHKCFNGHKNCHVSWK
jgi:hypothetical protein